MNIPKRFKNYGLWVAIFGLIPMILELFGVSIIPEEYNKVVVSLLSIGVALGIINNPEKGKGYLDK